MYRRTPRRRIELPLTGASRSSSGVINSEVTSSSQNADIINVTSETSHFVKSPEEVRIHDQRKNSLTNSVSPFSGDHSGSFSVNKDSASESTNLRRSAPRFTGMARGKFFYHEREQYALNKTNFVCNTPEYTNDEKMEDEQFSNKSSCQKQTNLPAHEASKSESSQDQSKVNIDEKQDLEHVTNYSKCSPWEKNFTSMISLPSKELVEVNVSCCISPDQLFLQLVANKSVLEEISNELQNLSPSNYNFGPFVVANIYAAIYPKDNKWYRVKINEVLQNDLYYVQYIDFGMHEKVNGSGLRHIPDALLKYPFQAIPCKLADVIPPYNLNSWSKEHNLDFLELVKCATFRAQLIRFSDKAEVDLIYDKGNSLSEVMVQIDIAKWNKRKSPTSCSVQAPLENKTTPITASQIKRRSTHVQLYKPDSVLNLLKEKETVILSIFNVLPNCPSFWARIIYNDNWSNILQIEKSMQDKISGGDNAINNYSAKLNEVVAAYSPSQKRWLRSYIRKSSISNFIARFVDYGNEEIVHRFYPLSNYDVAIPSSAVFCTLEGQISKKLKHILVQDLLIPGCTLETVSLSVTPEKAHLKILIPNSELSCHLTCVPWYYSLNVCLVSQERVTGAIIKSPSASSLSPSANISKTIQKPSNIKLFDVMERSSILNLSEVCISWIGFGECYVQNVHHTEAIQSMTEELRKQDLVSDPDVPYKPIKNEMVCAKFTEDQHWYRGCVLEFCSTSSYLVFFVDYGNKEEINNRNIRPLTESLASYPIFATCVNVEGLSPESLTEKCALAKLHEVWTLHKIDACSSNITVKLINKAGENASTLISAYEQKREMDEMQESCSATASTSLEMDFSSSTNQSENLNRFSTSDVKYLDLSMGEHRVVFTNILNPEAMFFQLKNRIASIVLSKLQTEIKEYCNSLPEESYSPIIEEVCFANFKEHGCWYRVKVLDALPMEAAVISLDYGYFGVVANKHLRPMTEEFLKHPAHCYQCALSDIPEQNEWDEDIISELQSLLPLNLSTDIHLLNFSDIRCYLADIPKVKDQLLNMILNKQSKKPARLSDNPSEQLSESFSAESGVCETADMKKMPPSVLESLKISQEISLTSVIDNSVWYCMLVTSKTHKLLYCMEKKLSEEAIENNSNMYRPQVNDIVSAYTSDTDEWYRSHILEIRNDKYFVLFIDYGYRKVVEKVRPLEAHHFSTPSHAIICEAEEDLNKENQKFISSLKKKGCHFQATVISNNKDKSVFKIAHPGLKTFIRVYGYPLDYNNVSGKSKFGPLQSVNENSNSKLYQQSAKISFGGIQRKTLLPNEEVIIVSVNKDELYVQCFSDLSDIKKMTDILNSGELQNNSNAHKPYLHEIVCAKYTDGVWYRGCVVKNNSDSCSVYYIDFGNIEKILYVDIRSLPETLRSFPAFATCVKLDGMSGNFKSNAMSMLENKLWTLKIVDEQCIPHKVSLTTKAGCDACTLLNQ